MFRRKVTNEGDIMLNEKKDQAKKKQTPKLATKADIAKAITKSNNKHAKMLKRLAE